MEKNFLFSVNIVFPEYSRCFLWIFVQKIITNKISDGPRDFPYCTCRVQKHGTRCCGPRKSSNHQKCKLPSSEKRYIVTFKFQVPTLELRHYMQLTRILRRQSSETSVKGRSTIHVDWQKKVATSMVQKTDLEDRTKQ